ncbi:MAG: DNA-binding protein [Clostridia bacterium]|nr:DNA-binding protein [Clostridia bacterium]
MSIYLGVDTSNYTTSFALSGDLDRNQRKILPVPEGQRGIRQSDGVFWHIKQAPELFSGLMSETDKNEIKAVGVSTRPRSVDGSYMPVFLAGETFAEIISATLGVPLYKFSHQDGHLMSAILSAGREDLLEREFFSVHLSGGTFEILKSRYKKSGFVSEIVGGTLDISAGQLLDRAGVKMGYSFPAGKMISELAKNHDIKTPKLSVSEKDGFINLSGAETQAMKLIETDTKENIAYALIEVIGKSLIKALNSVGATEVLMAGGVISSDILRKYLKEFGDISFSFATPEMSSDNAWGIAKLTEYMEKGE